MKIEFDWKSFLLAKPEQGVKLIIKNDEKTYIGEYLGIRIDGVHEFIVGKLNLISLSKKNTERLEISNFSDTLMYIKWDYYTSDWK